jgi:hypothetical protein
MCMCIECVGDIPEPTTQKLENGKWIVVYLDATLTAEHETEDKAWAEFVSIYCSTNKETQQNEH